MDPTRIKSGERASSLPVPAGPSAPEPYQHAPTLMAGAEAGKQGQVRVWGPDKRKLWLAVTTIPTLLAISVGLAILFHNPGMLAGLVSSCIGLFAVIKALYRPCYVTTDDAGIGITTWNGSRALRWEEIKSAKSVSPGAPGTVTLSLESEDDVEISLTGYPPAIQKELFSLIISRSWLCQHPVTKNLYVHEGAVPVRMRAFFISGILVTRNPEDRLVIEAVAPSSFAKSAGIEPGDELLAVDGQCVDGLSGEEVALALSRPAGKSIALRLRRPAQEGVHEYRVRTQLPFDRPALAAAGDLGVSVRHDEDGRLFIDSLSPSCAAVEAGLRPHDELLSVNGYPADAISAEQAQAEMNGPSGTMIYLTVRREEGARIEEYRLETRSIG